jgi:hypothetical protein
VVTTLPAEKRVPPGGQKKRRRLPLPLFVLIGLESTAFVAVGIAAAPWSVVSVTDIPVTFGAVAVALLAILSMTWKAARREMREARVAEEVAEELVSLEDLHKRIQLYGPKHMDVEAPSRAATPHFLNNAGIHTSEPSAEWAADLRRRVGIPNAEGARPAETDAPAAGQVTSDPDEDVARWRDAALALVAETPVAPPTPATPELGWKVPSVTTVPDPISRTPEALWAVAESRIRAVMLPEDSAAADPAKGMAIDDASADAAGETPARDTPAVTTFPAHAEPALATFFELPAVDDPVIPETNVWPPDLEGPDVVAEPIVSLADRVAALAESVLASAEPVPASEPSPASAEAVVELEAMVESLAEPVAAQSEDVPELKALVRALDALRAAAEASSAATDSGTVSSFRTTPSWEPAVDEVDGSVTSGGGSRTNTPTSDGSATAWLGAPSPKSSSSANADSLSQTAGRRGPVGRRRAFRRRGGARADGAGETPRSITVVAPSRPREGAEVRLRLDLDGDGLAALLQALEQLKSDDVSGQPGLVVIPGGKPASRAN